VRGFRDKCKSKGNGLKCSQISRSSSKSTSTNDQRCSSLSADETTNEICEVEDFCSKQCNFLRRHSNINLDIVIKEMKEEGMLTCNAVHFENPLGISIDDVYEGVHDGPVLGSGITGLIRLCKHKKTGVKYAVKCLSVESVHESVNIMEYIEQIREEIHVMCQLDHPNIVQLEEVYQSPKKVYIVLEFCQGGDLFEQLDQQPDSHYTEQQVARIVREMLSAVRYMHSKGIVHRDLKLENFVFVSKEADSELKLIDFGLSKHFDERLCELVGSPYTVSPEVLLGNYDERCDIWGIGVLAFLLLSGDAPFGGCGGPESDRTIRDNILRGSFKFEPECHWAGVSKEAKDFVRSLLVKDPEMRPRAHEAQQSEWLKKWAPKNAKQDHYQLKPEVMKALASFKDFDDLHKVLCEVLSFVLLPHQLQDLRLAFDRLDLDGCGEICIDTLKKGLMNVSCFDDFGSFETPSEEEIDDICNAIIINKKEKKIRWHEFIAANLGHCNVDERNLRLAFERVDSDHKGYIVLNDIMDLIGSNAVVLKNSMPNIFSDCLRKGQCKKAQLSFDDFLLLMR